MKSNYLLNVAWIAILAILIASIVQATSGKDDVKTEQTYMVIYAIAFVVLFISLVGYAYIKDPFKRRR